MTHADAHQQDMSALASHSLAHVLAVSILLTLAVPVVLLAVSYPTVTVAFAAGLLATRARHAIVAAFDRVRRISLPSRNPHRPSVGR